MRGDEVTLNVIIWQNKQFHEQMKVRMQDKYSTPESLRNIPSQSLPPNPNSISQGVTTGT